MPPRDYYAALAATAVAVIANVAYWYYVRRRDTAELAAARAELATRKSRGERDGARAGVTFSVSATSGGGAKEPGSGAASPREPVRVYLDGCFDMLHYGHANALRQAKAAGDVLVVGLVNDAEIVLNKGSQPVMTEDERYAALVACKFVDEVIRDAPYNLHKDWVDELISKHKIKYILHGDDPCFTADGQDAYAYAKQIGVYKQVKRTEGVSTTDIVGRMLLMTREHHVPPPVEEDDGRVSPASCRSVRSSSLAGVEDADAFDEAVADAAGRNGDGLGGAVESTGAAPAKIASSPRHAARRLLTSSRHSRFLPTARRIMQFAEGRVPKPEDKVVYMAGSWDVFNPGHVAALAAAREHGTFLLVGIYDDPTINRVRGHGLPILNLYERTLSLLSCKHVDEVIIGAPLAITQDLITSMNIDVIVRGTTCDLTDKDGHDRLDFDYDAQSASYVREEAYAVPAKLGILRTIPSRRTMTALQIVARIMSQRDNFTKRYEVKAAKEAAYVAQKTYVVEA